MMVFDSGPESNTIIDSLAYIMFQTFDIVLVTTFQKNTIQTCTPTLNTELHRQRSSETDLEMSTQ